MIADALVRMKSITKQFQNNVVLKNVDFDLKPGEVHILFGENGAGKSTLISILSGVLKPCSGSIFINEKEVFFKSPNDAKRQGIGTVFQEFSLVPNLSVAQNIYLGEEPHKFFWVDTAFISKNVERLFSELDFNINIQEKVLGLSRAEQQMVEIAKAIKSKACVLILDEPTASLTDKEVNKLFELLKKLKSEGVGIIYISHRIQEFRNIADRITVLRDGKKIDTFLMSEISDKGLVESMSGRTFEHIYPAIHRKEGGKTLMSLNQFKAKGASPLSLEVKSGEVLGIAGLVGSGKSLVWRSVMGLHPKEKGSVRIGDKEVYRCSTREMIKNKVFYLPPDRKEEGLQLQADTRSNIGINAYISNPRRLLNFGIIRQRKKNDLVDHIAQKAELKQEYLSRKSAQLSGGNQQKILFSKGLISDYDIYILDEPTVGVDIGTRSSIYDIIKQLAEAGKAVVVISSDLPEVVNLSHRAIVFREGSAVADLEGSQINESHILSYFF